MNIIKLYVFSFLLLFLSCNTVSDKVKVEIDSPVLPVLVGKEYNPVQKIRLINNNTNEINEDYLLKRVVFSLKGTTDINDIEEVALFKAGVNENFETDQQFGMSTLVSEEIAFNDSFQVTEDTLSFWVAVRLKEEVDLSHRVKVTCKEVDIDDGKLHLTGADTNSLRVGVAVRQHNQDNVHTSRIPGLATSNDGTLMAIYDARYESARDLQGHMDIAMNRSFDGGRTWEPMQIVLDMNEWGSMPEKYNGVSDACILVDGFINGTPWGHSPDMTLKKLLSF